MTHFRRSKQGRWLRPSSRLQWLPQLLVYRVRVRLVARVPNSSRNRQHNWWDRPKAVSCSNNSRTSILCSAIRCSSRS